MFRMRHQLFYGSLLLAIAAVYSALASIQIVMFWRHRRGH
jgi:hypothetical protein